MGEAQKIEAVKALTESVACPLCESANHDVLRPSRYPHDLSIDALRNAYHSSSDHVLMDQIVKCRGCSLVYLNPRLKAGLILSSYSTAQDPVFVKQNAMRIKTFRRSLQSLIKRLEIEPSRDSKVLDIGCAGGAFPKAAYDLGFSVVGIEPSRWLCEHGKKEYGLELLPGVFSDYSFDPASFKMITLWDVVEHLTEPTVLLRQAWEILRDDGYLIVNYPDYASLARRFFGKKWPFFLSVHLNYFTPRTITRLLEKCGYSVLEIRPFWQTLELGYIFSRAGVYFKPFHALSRMSELLSLDELPMTYNLGQSMVIARKTGK